jgi:hypothetical protein
MSMGFRIGIGMSEQVKRIPPPAGHATAQLEMADVPTNGDTMEVGNKTYTFTQDALGPDEIPTGTHSGPADFSQMFSRVGDTINNDTADTLCTADMSAPPLVLLTANEAGAGGDAIPLSITGTWATVTPFSGGE